MTAGTAPWAGLSYGAVERLLADVHQTSTRSIRFRFRKLRQRPFPDEIRSGIGVRINYDLPRILALIAAFELNRIYVPQGQAAGMIEDSWPEWARAFITAASSAGLIEAPVAMPGVASPIVTIMADAFRDPTDGPELVYVGAIPSADGAIARMPTISIDAGRCMAALSAAVGNADRGRLAQAFNSLEKAFGWTSPATPHRASVTEMSTGRGFLDEGPYFARARALLQAPDEHFSAEKHPIARARLQSLLGYLERPAPIDCWKAEIGSDELRPRLRHLLGFWSISQGLDVGESFPATMEALGPSDARGLALQYISTAETIHGDRTPPLHSLN